MRENRDQPVQAEHIDTPVINKPQPPIRVALVLAAFPSEQRTPFKYFLLLLHRLQTVFEFEFFDISEKDPLVTHLKGDDEKDADATRDHLLNFAGRVKETSEIQVAAFDLSQTLYSQVIVITLATLSNHHYLIRRRHVSLLALGEWKRRTPPSSLPGFEDRHRFQGNDTQRAVKET